MTGTVVGHYRILEKIGDGGMGDVYRAQDLRNGSHAALKILHPRHLGDRDLVERFANEAKMAGRIRHPGCVKIYGFGIEDERCVYIAMEYLQGEDLGNRLRRRGSLPMQEAILICRQVASALEVAHYKGIIHRDLKPTNLFLVPDSAAEGGERVKLLDFGVAKIIADESLSMTKSGTVIGTPTYMSPEQCRGTGLIDHRTDLYSLGCIFFRMVCGCAPFVKAGYGEMLSAHMHEVPPVPSSIESRVPPAFDALILRLLRKDPGERFQSARDFQMALDEAVANSHLGLPEPIIERHQESMRYSLPPTPLARGWFPINDIPSSELEDPSILIIREESSTVIREESSSIQTIRQQPGHTPPRDEPTLGLLRGSDPAGDSRLATLLPPSRARSPQGAASHGHDSTDLDAPSIYIVPDTGARPDERLVTVHTTDAVPLGRGGDGDSDIDEDGERQSPSTRDAGEMTLSGAGSSSSTARYVLIAALVMALIASTVVLLVALDIVRL